jgi:hypothetical protein
MSTFDDGSTERPSGQSAETTGDIGRGARDSGPGWYHQRLMRAIGALMNRCSDYDKMRSIDLTILAKLRGFFGAISGFNGDVVNSFSSLG